VGAQVVAGEVLVLALVQLPAGQGDRAQVVLGRLRQAGDDRAAERALRRHRETQKSELISHVRGGLDGALGLAGGFEGPDQPVEQLVGGRSRHGVIMPPLRSVA
jgi:hypothetical protein